MSTLNKNILIFEQQTIKPSFHAVIENHKLNINVSIYPLSVLHLLKTKLIQNILLTPRKTVFYHIAYSLNSILLYRLRHSFLSSILCISGAYLAPT